MHVYKYLVGMEIKNMESDSSDWCPAMGQEAIGRNRNTEGVPL